MADTYWAGASARESSGVLPLVSASVPMVPTGRGNAITTIEGTPTSRDGTGRGSRGHKMAIGHFWREGRPYTHTEYVYTEALHQLEAVGNRVSELVRVLSDAVGQRLVESEDIAVWSNGRRIMEVIAGELRLERPPHVGGPPRDDGTHVPGTRPRPRGRPVSRRKRSVSVSPEQLTANQLATPPGAPI